MTLQKLLLLCAVILASTACCSSEKSEDGPGQEISAKATEGNERGEKYFLRRAPDPCAVLTLERAQAILGSDIDVGTMAGNGNFGQAGGVCNYLATEGKHVGVTIQLRSNQLVDSNSMTTEELIAVSEKMKGIPGAGFIKTDGPGVKNLALVDNRQVYLDVFTGIGGTQAVGYEIVSEAVLHYSISDRTKTGEENLKILKELATEQFETLDTLARAGR